MKETMKKTIALSIIVIAFIANAIPHSIVRPMHRPPAMHPVIHRPPIYRHHPRIVPPLPVVPYVPHQHHPSRYLWATAAGAFLTSSFWTPFYSVYVPPVYEDMPIYDAYGNVLRYKRVLVKGGYYVPVR